MKHVLGRNLYSVQSLCKKHEFRCKYLRVPSHSLSTTDPAQQIVEKLLLRFIYGDLSNWNNAKISCSSKWRASTGVKEKISAKSNHKLRVEKNVDFD